MNVELILKELSESGINVFLSEGRLMTSSEPGSITNDVAFKIKNNRNEIVEYLNGKKIKSHQKFSAPASYAQQRLWLVQEAGDAAHYNMSGFIHIDGMLNYEVLSASLKVIIERHQSLRTIFQINDDSDLIQVVMPSFDLNIDIADISDMENIDQQEFVDKSLQYEACKEFDLSCDLMLRASLYKLADNKHIFAVTMHHISSDGWSVQLLLKELSILYSAKVLGNPALLPELNIQYIDYAIWQRNTSNNICSDPALDYWINQLEGLPPLHNLPLTFNRPKVQKYHGDSYSSYTSIEYFERFHDLCVSKNATVFMGLYTVFSMLLSRFSNESDIIVGTPVANRGQVEISNLIGFFVNTLVLRLDLSGNPTFQELLDQSKSICISAFSHQEVPFEKIVDRLQPERDLSYEPLFQILFAFQNTEKFELNFPGLVVSEIRSSSYRSKYDLFLDVKEHSGGLALKWEFNTSLFSLDFVETLASTFQFLISEILDKPEMGFQDIDLLPSKNVSALVGIKKACNYIFISDIFVGSAKRFPNVVALQHGEDQFTFDQLDQYSNKLANYMSSNNGVQSGDFVAVCLNRSIDLIVSMLAILKLGCVYIPLDQTLPVSRLKYVVQDCDPLLVICNKNTFEYLEIDNTQSLILDNETVRQSLDGISSNFVINVDRSIEAAYLLYTSGSTGKPKGVLQTHQTIVNLVLGMRDIDHIDRPLKTLQYASCGFDVSIQEIATAWLCGSTLVLIEENVKKDIVFLANFINKNSIERVFLPPAVFNILIEMFDFCHNGISLKEIFVAGEAIVLSDRVRHFLDKFKKCDLWNHYGPTETHVVTRHLIKSNDLTAFIGFPIPNVRLHILNKNMVSAPPYAFGDLYVSGAGLALGYFNNIHLTQASFINKLHKNANNDTSDNRLYKTGDMVRLVPGKGLEFLSRSDEQIKIRGFRIELSEIEIVLKQYDAVQDCAVVVMGTNNENKYIIAYLTCKKITSSKLQKPLQRRDLVEDIKSYLGKLLPNYMVPSDYILLDQMPLSSNGKLDKGALPEPSLFFDAYIAPSTSMERELCELVVDLLSITHISIHENFFRLGMNSILATKLVAKINKKYDVVIPLQTIFLHQTIHSLSNEIEPLCASKYSNSVVYDESDEEQIEIKI